jgi:two-component system NtrC family sensor kinase
MPRTQSRSSKLTGTLRRPPPANAALVERVKELTCLHGITHVLAQPSGDLTALLHEVLALLPPAWQYPDAARARIVLDGTVYETPGFSEVRARQEAEIIARGRVRGMVAVGYVDERPAADEGPFLREERALLTSVAHELAGLVEHRSVDEERAQLQEQLHHAERLATIGQLSAGVAHELNEPLAAILGFAQLCRKHEGLPPEAKSDLDKIITAALHAREVVSKLVLFARPRPPARKQVDLAGLVSGVLTFLEGRARKTGVQIERHLAPDLPSLLADPNQLYQVLVNLVVNAIQAMPHGGPLTLETYADGGTAVLAVEDRGAGMPPEIQARIFEPFFTTKGPQEGTGLGLSVVHGIVTAHGGSIHVRSEPGGGSRFEVRLPFSAGEEREEGTVP